MSTRRDWERRFPALDGTRTHWVLTCDGGNIAATDDLIEALDLVEANKGRCTEIKVYPGLVSASGSIFKDDNRGVVIWDRKNQPIQ